jgi:hypothetical protein
LGRLARGGLVADYYKHECAADESGEKTDFQSAEKRQMAPLEHAAIIGPSADFCNLMFFLL